MNVVFAGEGDLKEIMEVYKDARAFMKATGNPDQWKDNYPSEELILSDIKNKRLYLVKGDNLETLAVFYSSFGEDLTYKSIYGGRWNTEEPYGIIHRIAVSKNAHGLGVSAFCFDWALKKHGSIRIDTHRDNLPMQRALVKFGFSLCGTIYLQNGEERIAFDIKLNSNKTKSISD